MATNSRGFRVQRPLTADELAAVLDTINDATNTVDLIDRVVRAVFTALLADIGAQLADFGPHHRLDPDEYAVPTSQRDALMAAVTNRATAWGTSAEVAFDLINRLPVGYDDPVVPAPAVTLPERRPPVHTIEISREAVDVVAACEKHLADLRACYGLTSPIYQHALLSWHRNLTLMLSMGLGAHTRVSADGARSLFVVTGSGYVYSIVWHPAHRSCTVHGCAATVHDNGTIHPPSRDHPGDGHEHRHGPHPGEWVAHS